MPCRDELSCTLAVLLLALGLAGCGKDDPGDNTPSDAGVDVEDTRDAGGDGEDVTLPDDVTDTIDAADTTDAGRDPIPAEDIDVALHELMCEIVWNCPNRDTMELGIILHNRFESLDACRQVRPIPPFAYQARVPVLQAFIAHGTIQYDPDVAAECIDGMYDGFCDMTAPSRPEVCDQMFAGTLTEGEACSIHEECQTGLQCETTSECSGTCQPRAFTLCGGVECRDDEYCESNACVPRKDDGEACANTSECSEDSSCDDSLGTATCVADFSREGGEACASTSACVPDYICVSNLCAKLSFVGDGETCALTSSPPRVCEPGLTCQDMGTDGLGTCAPPLTAGAPCESYWQCEAELYCDAPSPGDPEQCLSRWANGSSCTSNQQCASYHCSSATNTCEPPPYCMP